MVENLSQWYRNLRARITRKRAESTATEEEQTPLGEEGRVAPAENSPPVNAEEELEEVTCCAFKKSRIELATDEQICPTAPDA